MELLKCAQERFTKHTSVFCWFLHLYDEYLCDFVISIQNQQTIVFMNCVNLVSDVGSEEKVMFNYHFWSG